MGVVVGPLGVREAFVAFAPAVAVEVAIAIDGQARGQGYGMKVGTKRLEPLHLRLSLVAAVVELHLAAAPLVPVAGTDESGVAARALEGAGSIDDEVADNGVVARDGGKEQCRCPASSGS